MKKSKFDAKDYMIRMIRSFGGNPDEIYIAPWMYDNVKAATKFDQQNGTSVSQRYDLPLTLDSDKLWVLYQIADRMDGSEVKRVLFENVYRHIVARHPKLKMDAKWEDVIMGVASEYNESDIYSFLHDGGYYLRPDSYKQRYENFQVKTGKQLYWVPSLKTLNTLYKHFGLE